MLPLLIKPALVVGHAVAPHLVAAATAIHAHAAASGMHPAIVHVAKALEAKSTAAASHLSQHAGHFGAKRAIKTGVKYASAKAGAVPVHAPVINYAVATKAGGVNLGRAAKMGAEVAAPVLAAAALSRMRETQKPSAAQ